jgi:hypothetical protein
MPRPRGCLALRGLSRHPVSKVRPELRIRRLGFESLRARQKGPGKRRDSTPSFGMAVPFVNGLSTEGLQALRK